MYGREKITRGFLLAREFVKISFWQKKGNVFKSISTYINKIYEKHIKCRNNESFHFHFTLKKMI